MSNDISEDERQPVERLVITQSEIDLISDVRQELLEIATHNPQVERLLRSLTPKLYTVINRIREKAL